ncbi:hypothetical protein AVEN_215197-1 [Araneus ventricosus]|uniref:Uncharacterized protein n=1 Tax=Araneus ventricosus TaxID=182803 RepID=A0A4Y2NEV2_ARAVE|nr:hypothetical protein AVEN_215197-1 [Araneus ventricosus]
MQVVRKSDPVTRAERDVGVKDGRLMQLLETDSEVQNMKGFSESETIVCLNTGKNTDGLFIVADIVSRLIRLLPLLTVGKVDELSKCSPGNTVNWSKCGRFMFG